jgi:hypothetical protein
MSRTDDTVDPMNGTMSRTDDVGLTREQEAALSPCFAAHSEIAAVYLFGSVARGEAGAESDVDLGIVFRRRGATARDHHDLLGRLAYSLSRVLGHERIDLVVLEPQGPIFCHRVLLEGRCVYEADFDRRVDFESETLVRAFDFRPTWELATRGKVEGLRRWLKQYGT